MKIPTRRSIIMVLLAVLWASFISIPALAQAPDDQKLPRLTLYDLNEQGYWWTQTPSVIGSDYPLNQYNWLVIGYDRHMLTWSQY